MAIPIYFSVIIHFHFSKTNLKFSFCFVGWGGEGNNRIGCKLKKVRSK